MNKVIFGVILAILVVLIIIIIAASVIIKNKLTKLAALPPNATGTGTTPTPASTANQQTAATQFPPATWIKLEKIAPIAKSTLTDDDGLNIAEIEVITDHKLVAADYTSVQASSFDLNNNPGVLVDGNTNGVWSTRGSVYLTLGERNPWLLLKMAKPAVISEVVIWNRTDCCQNRMAGAILSLLDASGATIASTQVPGNFNGSVYAVNFANKTVSASTAAPPNA